jgi:hypothetical protein
MNTGSPQAAAASVRGALASACGQPCTIDVSKSTGPTRNKLTERDRSMYKIETALTQHSRRSRSSGNAGHLRPESSVILSGIRT